MTVGSPSRRDGDLPCPSGRSQTPRHPHGATPMPHAQKLFFTLLLAVTAWSPAKGDSPARDGGRIELDLRRRDPASGEVNVTRETLDPRRVGVVVVDMWNWHWCKTAAMR